MDLSIALFYFLRRTYAGRHRTQPEVAGLGKTIEISTPVRLSVNPNDPYKVTEAPSPFICSFGLFQACGDCLKRKPSVE
jgi:hypothetical protein